MNHNVLAAIFVYMGKINEEQAEIFASEIRNRVVPYTVGEALQQIEQARTVALHVKPVSE
jgi:hypothetical protein